MVRDSPGQVLTGVVIGFALGFGVGYLFHQHTKSQLDSTRLQLESARQDIQEHRYRIANLTDINEAGIRSRAQLNEELLTLSAANAKLQAFNEEIMDKINQLEILVEEQKDEIKNLISLINAPGVTSPGTGGGSLTDQNVIDSGGISGGEYDVKTQNPPDGFVTNRPDGFVTNR